MFKTLEQLEVERYEQICENIQQGISDRNRFGLRSYEQIIKSKKELSQLKIIQTELESLGYTTDFCESPLMGSILKIEW